MLRTHSILPLAILPLASVVILPLALGGCVGALIVGGLAAAGGAGYEAAQERGVDGSYDDYAIKTSIENAWINANPALQSALTVTVYNGRVLLTGDASDPGMKRQAYDLASQVPGVARVYDEIEVASGPDAWNTAQDAWITTRVRSDLIVEKGVRSGNYTIETANGTVYLMGSARSQDELDKATYLARYVPGVKRVVSYVEIRSGVPVAQQQGPAPMAPGPPGGYSGPSGYSAPPSAPSGSSAPIQVQRL